MAVETETDSYMIAIEYVVLIGVSGFGGLHSTLHTNFTITHYPPALLWVGTFHVNTVMPESTAKPE